MGTNRDRALEECQPELELAFSREEFRQRLERIRARMDDSGLDVLWLMAPESRVGAGVESAAVAIW